MSRARRRVVHRRISVTLPTWMIDAIDVVAHRNGQVEPGYGDTRRDMIEFAVTNMLADDSAPTRAELAALRRRRGR